MQTHHFTDRIKKRVVKVAYCPIKKVLADFFKKLLKGQKYARSNT